MSDMTTPLVQRLMDEADCQHRNALTFKKGSLGRDDHLYTEKLLREAAEALAEMDYPAAWLVLSERAGEVCVELTEIGADVAITGVVKEYGDAYGKISKVPLYTTTSRAGGGEVGAVVDRKLAWRKAEIQRIQGTEIKVSTHMEHMRIHEACIADLQDIRAALLGAGARGGENG